MSGDMDPLGLWEEGLGAWTAGSERGCVLGAGGPPHLFGILNIHHEVVHMLLCLIKLQLPGHHGHQQGCAADPLWAQQVLRHRGPGALSASCVPPTLSLLEPSQQPQLAGTTLLVDKQANPLGENQGPRGPRGGAEVKITHLSATTGHGVYTSPCPVLLRV